MKKSKSKTILLRLMLVSCIAFLFFGLAAAPVSAIGTDGEWVLSKTYLPESGMNSERDEELVISNGNFHITEYFASGDLKRTMQYTYTVPPDTLRPGEFLKTTLSIVSSNSDRPEGDITVIMYGKAFTNMDGTDPNFHSGTTTQKCIVPEPTRVTVHNTKTPLEIEFHIAGYQAVYTYDWKPATGGVGGITADSGKTDVTVDTSADKNSGETGANIPAILVLGALGAVAAAGAAGAIGKQGEHQNRDKPGSKFKMYVQKDFGSKIRLGGKPVFVYARMAEIKSDGAEVERPDLTAGIQIFSPNPYMEIGSATLDGSYMGASVKADYFETSSPEQGIISFKFTGEGGTFQNNIAFELVGGAQIRIEDAWLLESDTDTAAEIPFQLLDFLSPDNTAVEFFMKEENLPFDIKLDYSNGDHGQLLIRRSGSAEKSQELMRGHMGSLIAKGKNEEAESSFVIRLCREGIYLDFDVEYGEESEKAEIRCYPGENGELPANRVGIGLAIWDEAIKRLRLLPPSELTVTCEDTKNIGEKIGLVWSSTGRMVAGRKMTDEKLSLWEVKAKKLLPYLEPVPVKLHVRGQNGDRVFEDVFNASLMPDASAYFDEYEKQFEHLWKLVDASFSPEFAHRYHGKLNEIHNRFGLADLRRAEMSFRKIIQYELERASIEASAVCDDYDNIIGVLEWTQWLGGICTDILLAIYTGPFGSFLVSNAKDILVEAITAYVEKPTLDPLEIIWMAGSAAVKNTFGSLDNLSDFPAPEKWTRDEFKKYAPRLAVWVSLYYVYRVVHHYYYDLDENNQRNLYEAAKSAGWDLAVKATLELFLTEYLSKSPQSAQVFGKDVTKLKDIAANDAAGFKQSREQTIDYIKENLPLKIEEFSGALLNYIGELRAGVQIVF